MKAACYIRVSTEHQLDNYSIAEQQERLQAFCKAKDITIQKIYTDGGYSGGNLQRPALQQMLSELDLFDLVIVYKLDRLSRSQKDTLFLIEDYFLSHHVNFISVCENFDTTSPLGRAMIGILSVFAQLEKEQITERFTMGRIGRAKNGYYHGGSTAPTGYDYINGKLVINEAEANQIRVLFERFRQGYSIHNCWKYMHSHYVTKYGNWKSESLIRNILRNDIYIGRVKFQKKSYPGIHTPIISESLFYEVQEMLENHTKQTSSLPFQRKTLLSGLLYCGQCGARFHGEHGKYSCYSRTKSCPKYIVDPNCRNKKWAISDLNSLIIDALCQIHYEPLSCKTMKKEGKEILSFPSEKAQSISDLLKLLFDSDDLSKQRFCLHLLIKKIYIDNETVQIILQNIF